MTVSCCPKSLLGKLAPKRTAWTSRLSDQPSICPGTKPASGLRSKSLQDERQAIRAGRGWIGELRLTICGFAVKASREREFRTMRGLMMALFALDFPGHDGALKASHWAGRIGVPFLFSVTTKAKTITKTTAFAKTTGKTV